MVHDGFEIYRSTAIDHQPELSTAKIDWIAGEKKQELDLRTMWREYTTRATFHRSLNIDRDRIGGLGANRQLDVDRTASGKRAWDRANVDLI